MITQAKFTIRGLLIMICMVIILQILILWQTGRSKDDEHLLANVYNLVNSLLPFFTVLLLILTFNSQKKQLHEQKVQTLIAQQAADNAAKQNSLQKVEDRFFAFLKIHRENGDNMTYQEEKGKRVFIEIFKKFEHMLTIVRQIVEKLEKNKIIKEPLSVRKKIELTYLLIFYGCSGENSVRMISSALKPFDRFLADKKLTFGAIIVKELAQYKTVADGFQANLGHYFRHLFQTVIYIHNQPILTSDEKKFYIKRLRAQFSNHEIAILFLNSFALGKRWTSYNSKQYPQKTDLITTYHLIQNLPAEFFASFDFRCFFPSITYEGDLHKFSQMKEYKNCSNITRN